MQNKYIEIDNDKDIEIFVKDIKETQEKTLIISLIQENRKLEEFFEVLDYVIYDNQDYISEIIDLDGALLQVNDYIDLLPSSYKIKTESVDLDQIASDIEKLEYQNVFYIIDSRSTYNIINLKETEKLRKGFWEKLKGKFIKWKTINLFIKEKVNM